MSFSKVILAAAAAVFIDYPEADEVYVTEDGNAWLPHAKHHADNHARTNGLPAPVAMTRKDVMPAELSEMEQRADAEAEASRKAIAEREKEAADKAAEEKAQKEAEDKAAEEATAKADAEAEQRAQDEADLKAAAEATTKQEAKPATPKGKGKGK